ncbi:MAG: hypothetical protein ACK56I_19745 [bacterium]
MSGFPRPAPPAPQRTSPRAAGARRGRRPRSPCGRQSSPSPCCHLRRASAK